MLLACIHDGFEQQTNKSARAPPGESRDIELQAIVNLITACIPDPSAIRRRQPISWTACMAAYYHDIIKTMEAWQRENAVKQAERIEEEAQETVRCRLSLQDGRRSVEIAHRVRRFF